MADVTSRIRIIFDGAVSGLTRAARAASRDLDRFSASLDRHEKTLDRVDNVGKKLNSGLLTMAKGFAIAGGAAATLQGTVAVVGALANVTAQLAPAALAVPGIILGIGVAYGTAKLALTGFTDAVKGDAKALAQFSAEGQKTVQAVRGLETGFKAMRSAVQDKFFANLTPEIKATGAELLRVGTIYLPKVAAGFNAMFVEGLRAARTPKFLVGLAEITEYTAAAVGRLRYVLANVLIGFANLGAIGAKYLEPLAGHISRAGKAFQLWTENGLADGSIERMIDRAIAGFKTLGRILADVGAGFKSLFSAFNSGLVGGGGTLESIERVTQAFRELAASKEAQAAFKTLGEVVKAAGDAFRLVLTTAIRELGPVIVELGPFLKELVTVMGERLARAIQTVAPYLREFARWLSENKEAIAPIVATLLRLGIAFKAISIARSVITGITAFATAMRTLATRIRAINPAVLRGIATAIARFLWPIAAFAGFAAFAKYIDELNVAAAGGDPEKLNGMADSLHDLIGAGQELASFNFVGIFKEIGDEWQVLIDKFTAGESPAGAAAQNINKFFDDLEISLQGTFVKIGESFQRDFVDVFVNLGTKIRDSFQRDFLDFFANLPTKVGEIFEGLKTAVATKLAEVTLAISNFFKHPAGEGFDIGAAVGQMIIDFLNGFATFATDTKAKLDETSRAITNWVTVTVPAAFASLKDTVVKKATEAWQGFQDESQRKQDEIVNFVKALPGKIAGALVALAGNLIKVALDAWNGFFGETKKGGDNAAKETGTVPGKVGTAISGLVKALVDKAKAAWDGLVNEFGAGIARAAGIAASLPGRVLSVIGNLGGTLVAAGASLIQGFINGINSKIPGIRAAASAAAAAARGFFGFSPAKEGPLSGKGWTLYSGHALADDFALGIRQNISTVSAAVDALSRAASGALDPAISITSAFDAAQLARAQAQTASRNLLGTAVNQVTAVATRESPAPVTNVTVLLSREQISEIARVVVEDTNRETARRVTAGLGSTF